MYLRTVASETVMPNSTSNSSAMRSSPYSGGSLEMQRMKLLCCLGLDGLPGFDLRCQNSEPLLLPPDNGIGFGDDQRRPPF